MNQLAWLDSSLNFPDTQDALVDPNGLLAAGGDLSGERLLHAYSKGIFPWYSDDQPILWWSPSPRMMLKPEQLHLGRSTRKLLKKHNFMIRVDSAFKDVIKNCAAVERYDQDGTWITDDIMSAFVNLHNQGHAHSIEAWQDGKLVGGLYGLAIGGAFFGESMFSTVSGASKVAFIFLAQALKRWQFTLIDCQIHTQYLASLGAAEVPRREFEKQLTQSVADTKDIHWQHDWPFEESCCDH